MQQQIRQAAERRVPGVRGRHLRQHGGEREKDFR
jgi:hypothetical protein